MTTDYRENFVKIFGDGKKAKGGRYVWDPEQKKFIPLTMYKRKERSGPDVVGDIDPFVSPIDGQVISSRSKLRRHNREHGVTNPRDYGEDYFKRKARERAAEQDMGSLQNVRQRRADLVEAIKKLNAKNGRRYE